MKIKLTTSLAILLLTVFSSWAQQNGTRAMGTWKLVGYILNGQEIPPVNDSIPNECIKLITQTHFTWVRYAKADSVVYNSAGGTYTLNDAAYTENLQLGSYGMKKYVGKSFTFKIRFDKDKMFVSGGIYGDAKIEEVWQKMK